MASLEQVKSVMKKLSSMNGVGNHLCFFGGSVPYIYHNKQSGREHIDIDVLVDERYMGVIREMAQSRDNYHEELDSLALNLDDDYGLKIFIDGVYVEFEPMSIRDGMFIRKSFSPDKSVAGLEKIPFEELEDLMIPIDIDGVQTFCESMELIKVGKEKYKREKDLKDIDFIDSMGIDTEKYERVKKAVEMSNTSIGTYEELRKRVMW